MDSYGLLRIVIDFSNGFLHPLGEIGVLSAMVTAFVKGHWGKPIWATSGGGELPVVDGLIALALVFTGPGRFSVDRLFRLRVPVWATALAIIGAAGTVTYAIYSSRPDTASPVTNATGEDLSPEDSGTI